MRLLFLVSSLPIKKIGGTEIMTLRICEQLARRRNHEPFIYTIAQSDEERKETTLQDMCSRYDITHFSPENISFADRTNTDGFLSYTRANLDFTSGLSRQLDTMKPDVVIAMKIQPPEFHCSRLSSILRKHKIPYVVMVRGFTDLRNSPVVQGYAPKRSIGKYLQDWYYYNHALPDYLRNATKVISQTAAQSELLKVAYEINSPVIFNPIDTGRIDEVLQASKTGDDDESLAIDDTSSDPQPLFRLIYVGSMIPRKNVPLLLRSLKILNDRPAADGGGQGPATRFTLTIVGGGRGEASIRKEIAELGIENDVSLVGKLQPAELWPLMAKHDIFVFPTFSEGFPNVLLEAMACGLPIVSSDFLGVRDIIRSEENGRIFDLGDASDLAKKILFLVQVESMEGIREHNREFVTQFTWETYMDRLEDIIGTLKGGGQ